MKDLIRDIYTDISDTHPSMLQLLFAKWAWAFPIMAFPINNQNKT